MKASTKFAAVLALAVALPAAVVTTIAVANGAPDSLTRPEGPCDIYAANGAPCVAAHSSTRALYASYNGPLYQVIRQSDGKTMDIGVVQPGGSDRGGYADAAAQDAFCANTTCWISVLYDQSGKGNHLVQAPRGGFSGPAMGGFNNIPIADMAPVTIMGHKVYGVYIVPGMGLRWNDAHGTAVDDQAEGQYWVINGLHYNTGCCFDYGNAETDSRDDGDGTMETTYFGNQPSWYRGMGPGPWIMTDQENNLVGCVNPDPDDKLCRDLPTVNYRFITATADGEPHHWRSMGGDAQGGDLLVYYDGGRIVNPRNSYDPMRKQGAILLGNGGDNSNGSSGTFYEAAMTAPGTFPSIECNQAIQANVVAAGYDVQRLAINAADKNHAPNGLQTFAPGSNGFTTVTFVNTTGAEIADLTLSIDAPRGWKALVLGSKASVKKIGYKVAPGQTVAVSFSVKSGKKEYNGDLVAKASWTGADGKAWSERAVEKVRNVPAVTINEFSTGSNDNPTDSFIELYNSGEKAVNISGWNITTHAANIPYFSSIRVPKGTRLAPKSFYLLGLATSGLAVDAAKGDETIWVRDVKGLGAGAQILVGDGKNAEMRTIKAVIAPEPQPEAPAGIYFGRAAVKPGTPTTLWQPLPEGPVITIPAGSTNVPVTSTAGFKVGQKMAIGYGATYPAVSNSLEKYEVVTVTEVGKPGTQAWLAYDAKPGDTNIKVSSVENITAGDRIRLDIDSEGHGIETVTVKSVGTASRLSPTRGPMSLEDAGTGLELEEPIKFAHSANMPFSVNGTGISFEPATKFDHSSNEPVLALIYGITLDKPLSASHGIDEAVVCNEVTVAGYQGSVPADQTFGGPALGANGNITLRNAKGLIVDALNYGLVTDPWLGEGFHTESGAGADGNFATTPAPRSIWGRPQTAVPLRSAGRYPDGVDTDDNKKDFKVQNYTNLASAAEAGTRTLRVSAEEGYTRNMKMYIGGEEVTVATFSEPITEISYRIRPDGARMEMRNEVVEFYLAKPLRNSYPQGTPLGSNVPTPGAPNAF